MNYLAQVAQSYIRIYLSTLMWLELDPDSVIKKVFPLQVYSSSVPLHGAAFSSPLYVAFQLLVSSFVVQTGREIRTFNTRKYIK